MNSEKVFLLWHSRPLGNNEEDSKVIGVYSSKDPAVKKEKESSLPEIKCNVE